MAAGVDDYGARALAVKLAEAVMRPVRIADAVRLTPTVSVGVTVGEQPEDLAELVARADRAMLTRKRLLYATSDRYGTSSALR